MPVAVQHTRESLKGSRGFLLQLFAQVVGDKEIMHVALVTQCVLAVRANWGIEMVLNLLGRLALIQSYKKYEKLDINVPVVGIQFGLQKKRPPSCQ